MIYSTRLVQQYDVMGCDGTEQPGHPPIRLQMATQVKVKWSDMRWDMMGWDVM